MSLYLYNRPSLTSDTQLAEIGSDLWIRCESKILGSIMRVAQAPKDMEFCKKHILNSARLTLCGAALYLTFNAAAVPGASLIRSIGVGALAAGIGATINLIIIADWRHRVGQKAQTRLERVLKQYDIPAESLGIDPKTKQFKNPDAVAVRFNFEFK